MLAFESQQDHPNSYYAATANSLPRYPQLKGSLRADVCVVGAGFTGLSTALCLAERGYSVVVLEANRVGWGASGRNGGQLIGGISGEARLMEDPGVADTVWAMRWRGHELIRDWIHRYAIDCDLKSGYMDAALKSRHMREFEQNLQLLSRHDFSAGVRLIDAGEARELLGTDSYIGGLVNEKDGHLHPLNLCIGEARAAESLGVRIFEHSTVEQIEQTSNPTAVTPLGRVEADSLVLAGHVYHRLEQRRLGGLLFPAGSFIIATEPLNASQRQQINPADLAVCDPNYVLDYFRLSADKRLLFGGRCNYSGRTPKSIQASILPRMLKIYPQLDGIQVDYEWGGHIGITIKRVPLIGAIRPNVFYAQGYSGHGVNVSHLAGEILADAVAGTMERMDVFNRVAHIRLPIGGWAGSQLVALGMLYFRLKDLL